MFQPLCTDGQIYNGAPVGFMNTLNLESEYKCKCRLFPQFLPSFLECRKRLGKNCSVGFGFETSISSFYTQLDYGAMPRLFDIHTLDPLKMVFGSFPV